MTRTVVGVLVGGDGMAYNPSARTRAWATPAAEVRSVQAAAIPVDIEHDGRPVGEVVHLERGPGGNLWCVAHVDAEPVVPVRVGDRTVAVEVPMFYSAERDSTPDDRDIIIRSVSLTASTARLGARPVRFLPGELNGRAGWTLNEVEKGLLHRAYEANVRRRSRDPLRIVEHRDLDRLAPAEQLQLLEDQAWQLRPLRYRPATIIGVR